MATTEEGLRQGLYGFPVKSDERPSVPAKPYHPQKLWARSHEMIRLHVLGLTNVQIARILNVHPQTVSNTLNSQLGSHKVSELQAERDEETKVRVEQIRILTDKALATYNEIFDNESGEATLKERKEAADMVLKELSGLRVPTKIMSQASVTVLTADEIREFKSRGISAMREAGLVTESPREIEHTSEDPNADS